MRKGVGDSIPIMIAIFIFAVTAILVYLLLSQVNVIAIETNSSVINQSIIEHGMGAFTVFDTMMPFLFIGLVIASIILAFLIPTHPIFLVISIIFWVITAIVAAQFSNVFEQFANQSAIISSADKFPQTVSIFQNLPLIISVVGAVMLIAMFAVWRKSSGEA
jgi:hypothetical protein